jgi:hypothetical protein
LEPFSSSSSQSFLIALDSEDNVFCDATFARIVNMNAEQLFKIYTTAKIALEKEKEKKPKHPEEVRGDGFFFFIYLDSLNCLKPRNFVYLLRLCFLCLFVFTLCSIANELGAAE